MNGGKICVSICAKTAAELFEQFDRAEPIADIVEARFDCMDHEEIERALSQADENSDRFSRSLLATFRTKEQGGRRPLSDTERTEFWSDSHQRIFWGGDFEEDFIDGELSAGWPIRIGSFHDFTGTPENIEEIYRRLNATSASILKIAVRSGSVTDGIPLWKMLERSRSEGKSLIPISMGEAGKWTRILGLAHGAFMTYASLDTGGETAPGQISAADMIDVFRVKDLDRNTGVYGIIAGDTSYSVSPWMHNAAFKAASLNKVFIPLQVSDLDEFMRRMVKPDTREIDLNFQGFSVTNPHKQAIMRYLDVVDETAAKIGAVNTVKIDDGKFHGYNTDAPGFIAPLKAAFGDLRDARVALFGAGGAARACIFALQLEGANVTLFVRDPEKAAGLGSDFGLRIEKFEISDLKSPISEFDILVNTTPLGTKGETVNKSVVTAEQLKGVKLVYDLIYNPLDTRLIREAKAASVPAIGGLEMLVAQGAKQFEIWTGQMAPMAEMSAAVKKRLGL